jgi:hypothetical protein
MHPILNVASQAAQEAGQFIASQLENINLLNK